MTRDSADGMSDIYAWQSSPFWICSGLQPMPYIQPMVYPMVYPPNQYARESSDAYNIPPGGGGGGGGGADAEIGFYGGRGEMGPSK